jgi:hypothetical protein
MHPMNFQLGRIPDDPSKRALYARHCPRALVRAGYQDDSTIIQPSAPMLDQKSLPSCVGKSYQGRLNALLDIDVSGVNLWIEARAIDGNLTDASFGTMASSVIEVLLENGWTHRSNPKEDDAEPDSESLTILPDLSALLEGDDHRISQAVNHEVFVGTDDEKHYAILAALREKNEGKFINALTFGTGIYSKFMNPPGDNVLDERYLSTNGSLGGHEQGVIGWISERNAYLIQGSWNDWTYCVIDGKIMTGHCLVSRAVIEHAWDVDKVRVM